MANMEAVFLFFSQFSAYERTLALAHFGVLCGRVVGKRKNSPDEISHPHKVDRRTSMMVCDDLGVTLTWDAR